MKSGYTKNKHPGNLLATITTPPLVYFARAMDDLDDKEIQELGSIVRRELAKHSLQMVDPYEGSSKLFQQVTANDLSQRIVDCDLVLLRKSDAVLMDMSIPKRNYVGCVCELVYAYSWGIPVIVYVGQSRNESRHWLKYHATKICQERTEAIETLAALLLKAEI